jgi:NAD(P)H-dependent FMN reductase
MKRIIVLNGSIQGEGGSCGRLAERFREHLARDAVLENVNLRDVSIFNQISPALQRADGFVFLTGTYWDSWGSPLQRFLEEATPSEGTDVWLGKPCAVGVLMHSVGGKGVLSRLQGVLNTFGVLIPPFSGFLYSTVNQLALERGEGPLTEDLWRLSDLEVVCHNLLEACHGSTNWRAWPVNRADFDKVWLEG